MSLFDPSKHGNGSGDRRDDGGGIPAGEYLLAMRWFERRTAKSGAAYLRAKYEVIHGPRSGQTFFANVSLDVSKAGVAGRLSVYCAAIGQDRPFDLNSDEAVKRAFLGKPFKAKVSVRESNGYTNTDLERCFAQVSPAERRTMDAWVLDQQEAEAMGDSRPTQKRGTSQQRDDDDIPF